MSETTNGIEDWRTAPKRSHDACQLFDEPSSLSGLLSSHQDLLQHIEPATSASPRSWTDAEKACHTPKAVAASPNRDLRLSPNS